MNSAAVSIAVQGSVGVPTFYVSFIYLKVRIAEREKGEQEEREERFLHLLVLSPGGHSAHSWTRSFF